MKKIITFSLLLLLSSCKFVEKSEINYYNVYYHTENGYKSVSSIVTFGNKTPTVKQGDSILWNRVEVIVDSVILVGKRSYGRVLKF